MISVIHVHIFLELQSFFAFDLCLDTKSNTSKANGFFGRFKEELTLTVVVFSFSCHLLRRFRSHNCFQI